MRSNGHQQVDGPAVPELRPTAVSPEHVPPLKILRFPAIRERTGLSGSMIWRLEQRGEFPKHHRISLNSVGWIEEEVVTWIRSRIDAVAM